MEQQPTLKSLKDRLSQQLDDERFITWMELISSPVSVYAPVIDEIVISDDAHIKILLCRFLGHLSDLLSIQILLRLLKDRDDDVVSAAIRSFDRNQYPQKVLYLSEVLDASSDKAKYYAIDKLSLGSVYDVVDRLIAMIPTAHTELLVKVLHGLRQLPDKRSKAIIIPLLKDKRENVRLGAYLVYGALYQTGLLGIRSKLLGGLQDPNEKIRKVVLWCMRNRKNKADLPYLFNLSIKDPNEGVRFEAILNLSKYPNTTVICHLFNIVIYDKNRMVILKTESVLMGMNKNKIIRSVDSLLRKNDSYYQARALLFLSKLDVKKVALLRIIRKALKRDLKDNVKIIHLESLGNLKNSKCIHVLERYLDSSSPILSYTALISLLKIGCDHDGLRYDEYLKRRHQSDLHVQMILKQLVRRGRSRSYDDHLIAAVIPYLDSKNMNTRYLAAEALQKSQTVSGMVAVIKLLKREENNEVIVDLIKRTLLNFYRRDKTNFKLKISEFPKSNLMFKFLSENLLLSEVSSDERYDILEIILSNFVMESPHEIEIMNNICMGVHYRYIHVDKLFQLFADVAKEEYLFCLFAKEIKKIGPWSYLFNEKIILNWFQNGSESFKRDLIDFMGWTRSMGFMSFLVNLLQQKTYSGFAVQAINESVS